MLKILHFLIWLNILFAVFMISLVQIVSGQDTLIPLTVDPNDSPLIITGQLNGTPASFKDSVRLTYTGEDATELIVLPSDLVSGDAVIQRSNVSIAPNIILTSNRPTDIQVEVNDVVSSGTYTGQIEFRIPEGNGVLVVPLELDVSAIPNVIPVDNALSLGVVRCDYDLECAIASLFFPGSAQTRRLILQFENQTAVRVNLTDATSSLRNDSTYLEARGISVDYANPWPSNTTNDVELIINTSELDPGSYSGSVRLWLEGLEQPVVVSLRFLVRRGPILPLLLIIFGILFGRLIRWMDTPLIRGQESLVRVIAALSYDTDLMRYEPGKMMITEKIAELRKENYEAKDESKLSEIQKNADDIADRIQRFRSLDKLYIKLNNPPYNDKSVAEDVKPKIEKAYVLLLSDKPNALEDAQQVIDEIKAFLNELSLSREEWLGGDEAVNVENLGNTLDTPRTDTNLSRPSTSTDFFAQVRSAFIKLVGLRTESLPLVRALVWLTLIGILGLIGFQTQYINTATTFGAGGIYDYLALLLWGMASDVASATILNLPK